MFSSTDSPLYTCGQYIDCFGDHLIGCGHCPCAYDVDDALCNIIYHALLEGNSEVRREQRISGESTTRPGDVFHPGFCNGSATWYDISVRSALHPEVLIHSSASTPRFAAIKVN